MRLKRTFASRSWDWGINFLPTHLPIYISNILGLVIGDASKNVKPAEGACAPRAARAAIIAERGAVTAIDLTISPAGPRARPGRPPPPPPDCCWQQLGYAGHAEIGTMYDQHRACDDSYWLTALSESHLSLTVTCPI